MIFGNGARSPIVLGPVPLTSLNRSFLWLTELSHSQNVTVPLSTRTNRRLKRSSSAARPRGDMPKQSTPLLSRPPGKEKSRNPVPEFGSPGAIQNSKSQCLSPLPMPMPWVVTKVDLSHCFSTRQAQAGDLWKDPPAWRYRVLKTALRLRPRRALSSALGQRRHSSLRSPLEKGINAAREH